MSLSLSLRTPSLFIRLPFTEADLQSILGSRLPPPQVFSVGDLPSTE